MTFRPRWSWSRATCADLPRPCAVLSCPHNLAREIFGAQDRAVRLDASEADLEDGADRVISWLSSSPASCVLDVVADNPDGADVELVAALLGIGKRQVNKIETGARVRAAFAELQDREVPNVESSCSRDRQSLGRLRRPTTDKDQLPLFEPVEGRCPGERNMYKPHFIVALDLVAQEHDGSFALRAAPVSTPLTATLTATATSQEVAAQNRDQRQRDFNAQIARMCRLARLSADDLKKHAPTSMLVVPDLARIIEDTAKRDA